MSWNSYANKPPKNKQRKKRTRKERQKKRRQRQFVQIYSLKAGLKKFGEKGRNSTKGEMEQLDEREVFYPIHVHELTAREKKRAMESLLFLVEKILR